MGERSHKKLVCVVLEQAQSKYDLVKLGGKKATSESNILD